jgi:dihydrofolate synthase/folylpolyglutamate synthase
VIDAGVVIISPISLDHQNWLGNTLTEIAFEKAQIIKDRSIVVVCHQEEVVLEVIERRALETDSVLWLEGRDWEVLSRTPGVGGQIVDVRTPTGVYEQLFVPLHGLHQAHNAAAALVATEAMMGGKVLPAEVVEEGFLTARSPGRLEVVRTSPTVVVDAAHNPAGVASLRDALDESFRFNVTIGLFSAMADKAIEEMLVEIEPDLSEIVLVPMGGDRAADLEDLKVIAEDVFGADRVHVAENVADGIDRATALADTPQDPTLTRGIVAFGSIQLVGEVTALLRR